jgi:peptide/nickel transport system permease protein
MIGYVLRRLGYTVLVVFAAVSVVFLISHLIPADPVRAIAGPHAGPEQVKALRSEWGLDKPLYQQYYVYFRELLHGNLGRSLLTRRPVLDDLIDYFPATVELTLVAIILALSIGLPLGLLSASQKDRWVDHLTRFGSITAVSMPSFWLGIMLQILFFKVLGLLPIGGRLGIGEIPPHHLTGLYVLDGMLTANGRALSSAVLHLILPALTVAASFLAVVTRMVRSSVVEVLEEDYIRTAASKGLPFGRVLVKHALRNALIPVVTVVGLQIGFLLGNSFVTEIVFSWPGTGLYGGRAVLSLDFPAIMGVVLLTTLAYSLINLAVDLLYTAIDPRIRYQ